MRLLLTAVVAHVTLLSCKYAFNNVASVRRRNEIVHRVGNFICGEGVVPQNQQSLCDCRRHSAISAMMQANVEFML